MNIALVFQHKLMLGLQHLFGSTARYASPAPLPQCLPQSAQRTALTSAGLRASHRSAAHPISTPPNHSLQAPKPLRVLRVLDNDLPRSSTGRMVISGRMADVCAELDRLAAREATLH